MKNAESKILVVGATGFLGTEICRQLVASNKNVIGLVRATSDAGRVAALRALGVELIEGDLKNQTSIQAALRGVTTVISNATSVRSTQNGDSIQSVDSDGQASLVEQAEAANVSQFIFISFLSMLEEFPLQNAKRKIEQKLAKGKMNFTILQPTFFMDVWLSPALGFDYPNAKATIYGDGKAKISWISIPDVAAWALAAVDNALFRNKSFRLGGPEALSPLEVVALFEKTSGKKFELTHVPVHGIRQQKNAATDDLTKTFSSLMLNYAAGSIVNMGQVLDIVPMKLSSVAEYSRRVV